MTDYIDLAVRYGGFTNLDRVYLQQVFAGLTDEQKIQFITPPPSVLNAYFAELYQKKSPQAATDYFLEMSQNLHLFNDSPSFLEKKPFIRLNLSGKSYGFCYENSGRARIFAEQKERITPALLFEIADIFPHYLVFQDEEKIKMCPFDMDETVLESQSVTPLTDYELLENGAMKWSSYNQEELVEQVLNVAEEKMTYYRSNQRRAMIYLV